MGNCKVNGDGLEVFIRRISPKIGGSVVIVEQNIPHGDISRVEIKMESITPDVPAVDQVKFSLKGYCVMGWQSRISLVKSSKIKGKEAHNVETSKNCIWATLAGLDAGGNKRLGRGPGGGFCIEIGALVFEIVHGIAIPVITLDGCE